LLWTYANDESSIPSFRETRDSVSADSGLDYFLKSNPTVKQLDDDRQIVVR